jgi:hypothetical protein
MSSSNRAHLAQTLLHHQNSYLASYFGYAERKLLENDDQILACKVLTSLRCAVSESCNMVFNSEGARDKGNHGRMGIVLEKSRRLICERKFSELMLAWSNKCNLATSKSTAFCGNRHQAFISYA